MEALARVALQMGFDIVQKNQSLVSVAKVKEAWSEIEDFLIQDELPFGESR